MTGRVRNIPYALRAVLILGSLTALAPQAAFASPFLQASTLILYDSDSGAIPGAPLMGFLDFPQNTALLTFGDGSTLLDTTLAGNDTYAGWVSTGAASPGFPLLNRMEGFQVNFTLQVESEIHAGSHRSGVSFIVLGADAKGIELAFWEDQIWAQADDNTGGLFTKAESIPFSTADLTDYQVIIVGESYTLTANGQPILTGPVRDYSAFSGFPDPYETPNFLFLGDDTTSAQARIRLSYVSVTGTEPVLPEATATIAIPPSPTASFTPPPTATPIPFSTAPAPETGFPICPSGLILAVGILPAAILTRKTRSG